MSARTYLLTVILATTPGCSSTPVVLETTSAGLDVSQWSDDQANDGELTPLSPAMATLNGHLYVVYVNGVLLYATESGDVDEVPSATTTARPSLVAFANKLFLFYASGVDQYMASFDGVGWTDSTPLPFDSLGAPAAAVWGSQLLVVRAEPTENGKLYWRTMDASGTFSAEHPIVRTLDGSGGCDGGVTTLRTTDAAPRPGLQLNEFAVDTPALVTVGSCVYMAHRNGTSNKLVLNSFGPSGTWGSEVDIGDQEISTEQPALGYFHGTLHLVHKGAVGSYGDNIWWSFFDPTHGWSLTSKIPNHKTHGTPALATTPQELAMAHDSSGPVDGWLWYSHFQ
jgi:hypothetical protein